MDFEKITFAEFLEQAIPYLIGMNATKLAIVAMNDDGDIGTTYFNADPADKARMAGEIQFDGWLERLEADKKHIRELLEDGPND